MALATADDALEINLTPLLDLVLQLVMFFMACVNFASEALSANVLLPQSLSTQEVQAGAEEEQLIINIELVRREKRDAAGQPVVDPQTQQPAKEIVKPRTTRIVFASLREIEFPAAREDQGLHEAQRFIRDLASNLRAVIRSRQNIPDRVPAAQIKIPIPVIIRGDAETSLGLVLKLMGQCKAEGFSEVRLRAIQKR